jgi:succinyl-CoA synthetase alpha subunit
LIRIPKMGESVIIQNITGRYGSLHAKLSLEYGTKVTAGTAPGKGGQSVEGVPVFDTVREAMKVSGALSSVVFVPAAHTYEAVEEAVLAGIKLAVVITEHVPIRDELKMLQVAREHEASIIGPNTPGVIVPSLRQRLGIMPANSFRPGKVALFSRSGTLMYEVAYQLSVNGLGQAVALGIGGDPINCTTMIECLNWAEAAPEVEKIVLVGEIGGDAEERVAKHLVDRGFRKPVVAYIAGRHAPKEKKMGHAGAIIYGNYGTAESKINALRGAGASVAMTPMEIPKLVTEAKAKG